MTAEAVVRLTDGASSKPWVYSGSARPFGFAVPAGPGTLLLMTDGVWKYANPAVLAEIGRRMTLDPSGLIDAARLPSSRLQDDAAAVVARFRPADDGSE